MARFQAVNLSRRDVLRIGAITAGVPLAALATRHQVAGAQAARSDPEPAPLSDAPPLEGEDHPDARARTLDNLKFMGLALHNYAARNGGRFPPAAIRKDGRPLLSWRVAILPFLDIHHGPPLYREFRLDEPWDSRHNEAMLKVMPRVFAPLASKDLAPPPGATYYQGFVGPGALFDGPEGTRFADITDGMGWTLMVVEAAEPVPWTKPEDLPFTPGEPLPKLGGQFEDGFYAALADGSARFLSHKVAPETLRALVMRGDGAVITFDKLGRWHRPRPGRD